MSTQPEQLSPFPPLPKSGIAFPDSPVITAAFLYIKQHTHAATYNHCVRSAYWALILAQRLPRYTETQTNTNTTDTSSASRLPNLETVVLACVLHDMGWATTEGLRSKDRRFEVDGANLARGFLRRWAEDRESEGESESESAWDAHRAQLVWDIIALHSTPSIALHAAPEVSLAALGIMADFAGPAFPADPNNNHDNNPSASGDRNRNHQNKNGTGEEQELGQVITVEEYKEVVRLFPLAGFGREFSKEIICGLCRDKPATTYDNFQAGFGLHFGLDGLGGGREEYRRGWEKAMSPEGVLGGFEFLEELVGDV
ncbi:Uu.00g066910.m01.CDS01 [Anthostomella pinea]|uniref:Uu.00g066910.m01.CDS01 n=1 Tax=Anthostomella pinea TaxID=933095 RepID=A0AAI8VNG0_9PEZI|nr:Uu.00g066910.m01.CDS01 [Anthostomella pinea]